jgi:GT2 family glycosyltransferase
VNAISTELNPSKVRLSFVTPVYNPPVWALRECAESVLPQLGPDVEWILADDGSSSDEHLSLLRELERATAVTVIRNEDNAGISSATNDAIATAHGTHIAFVDQDDLVAARACEVICALLNTDPEIDVLYSDEDKIDEEGRRYGRFRKPDWSPERLRHQNYLSHLTVIRRELIELVGGLRPEFDGSQDFDLVLRCTERARKIVHIPEVLYHWRSIASSTASDPSAKPSAHLAAVRAVQEHLDRVGIDGQASLMPNMYLDIQRTPAATPTVSVVIPSCGSEARIGGAPTCLVENCVASVLQVSTYSDIEVIVVLDEHSPAGLAERLRSLDLDRVTIVPFAEKFNFSAKINLGVLASHGDVIIPLNDDTQVATPTWIEELLVHLEEPDVAMVAPLLLLEDGRVQSAGHFFEDGAHHVGAGLPFGDPGPFGVMSFPSERSGATFAAVAIRRDVFETVGGLCEEFPRAFNDVDFGNKLRRNGFRIIFTPKAVLHHFESLTRDPRVEEFEVRNLYRRWGSLITTRDEYLPSFWRQCYALDR